MDIYVILKGTQGEIWRNKCFDSINRAKNYLVMEVVKSHNLLQKHDEENLFFSKRYGTQYLIKKLDFHQ